MTAWLPQFAVAGRLWHVTWEASLLALMVLSVQSLFRKKLTARWNFALWWLVVLRLLLPVSIPAPWSAFNWFAINPASLHGLKASHQRPAIQTAPDPEPEPARPPMPGAVPSPRDVVQPQPLHSTLWTVVSWIWLAGALMYGVGVWLAGRRLNRFLKSGRKVEDPALLTLLQSCAAVMSVRRIPLLVATSQLDSPAVVGCARPKLILPEHLCSTLSPEEWRHVFLHELAHIRRHDLMMKWVLCGLTAIHWFNPILHYAFKRIQADRELACDALALSRMSPGESRSYGETILKLLENLTRPATLPGMVGLLEEKQQMKRRIEMIADTRTRKSGALAVALLMTLGLVTLTDAQNTTSESDGASYTTPTQGEVAQTEETVSSQTRQEERQTDVQHLQQIYKAIQAYYQDHNDLPNWLSDLVPDYLPDASVLISPIEKRTGKSVLFGREDPKIHTSYIYEFNVGAAAEEFNKGRTNPISCKEWKLTQLHEFGMITPILRSHIDQPVLNVAYSGQIYETGLLWEDDPNTIALIKKYPQLGPPTNSMSGPRLPVHVVDSQTGSAISGAQVNEGIGSEFGLLPPGQLVTDASGEAEVPLGEWQVNFLYLTVNHPGYYSRGFNWNRKTSPDPLPKALRLELTSKPADQ